jgi:lipoprotein NlpI
MNIRASIVGTVVCKRLGCKAFGAAAAAVLFAASIPCALAQSGAAPPATKPAAASEDPFSVTPPAAKTAPAAKADSDKSAADKSGTDKAMEKPAADKPADVSPKTPAKPDPFRDDKEPPAKDPAAKEPATKEPGSLVPSPRPGVEAPAPHPPGADAPITLTPTKPTSNEPSDLKSTETEMVPGAAEFNQGQDLAAAGKYAAAIEAYKKSLKLAKDDASTYEALGVAYRMLNRYDDAIVALTESIRIQPDRSAEPYLRRGICWFQKEEYGLAGLDFDYASGIDFTDPRAATWKGMTLVRQGLLLDAVNTYSSALRYDNRFVLAHVNRGLVYAALHDYKKAIIDFDGAINVTPKDPTLYFKRAIAESSGGDWKAAVSSYTEAIRLDSHYAAAFKNRSEAYRRLGDTAHAKADSQRALELTSLTEKDTTKATTTSTTTDTTHPTTTTARQ